MTTNLSCYPQMHLEASKRKAISLLMASHPLDFPLKVAESEVKKSAPSNVHVLKDDVDSSSSAASTNTLSEFPTEPGIAPAAITTSEVEKANTDYDRSTLSSPCSPRTAGSLPPASPRIDSVNVKLNPKSNNAVDMNSVNPAPSMKINANAVNANVSSPGQGSEDQVLNQKGHNQNTNASTMNALLNAEAAANSGSFPPSSLPMGMGSIGGTMGVNTAALNGMLSSHNASAQGVYPGGNLPSTQADLYARHLDQRNVSNNVNSNINSHPNNAFANHQLSAATLAGMPTSLAAATHRVHLQQMESAMLQRLSNQHYQQQLMSGNVHGSAPIPNFPNAGNGTHLTRPNQMDEQTRRSLQQRLAMQEKGKTPHSLVPNSVPPSAANFQNGLLENALRKRQHSDAEERLSVLQQHQQQLAMHEKRKRTPPSSAPSSVPPPAPTFQNDLLESALRKRQHSEAEERLSVLQQHHHQQQQQHDRGQPNKRPRVEQPSHLDPASSLTTALSNEMHYANQMYGGSAANPHNTVAILDHHYNRQRLLSHQRRMLIDAEMEELLSRHHDLNLFNGSPPTALQLQQKKAAALNAAASASLPYGGSNAPDPRHVNSLILQQEIARRERELIPHQHDFTPLCLPLNTPLAVDDVGDGGMVVAPPKQHYSVRPYMHLGTDTDEIWLSRFLSFLRVECIEVFTATRTDVFERKTSKKIHINQVGLRCRFCAHLPYRARVVRSSCFPSSICRIYQSLTMMIREHFSRCQEMPKNTREKYTELKWMTKKGEIESKSHWIESAKSMGMVDTEKGIFLNKPVKLTFPCASPAPAST
jgi:hypothetical protein